MNDLRIVNLSTYTSPEIVEQSNKDWISYGTANDYFQYLIDRYNGSPTNNAIINAISEMIYGRGLDALNSNKKPEQYAKMVSLFHKDVVRKLCYDLKLMGQCSMQVIYSKDRKTIAQVEHIPVENLRAEKCNDKGEIEAYFYSDDWSKVKNSESTIRIPAFGFSKENIEIVYVKPYRAGYKYYSSPDYAGGLQYAELEQEISNYHLNNILQGLAPSMLINFNNGTPNAEERQMLENRIYQKFSGSSNAGKFILAFNDSPESAATIEPIQLSDAHNQYQFLSDESSKKILVAHRCVSPMLVGIKDNTGLGNNAEELKTASTLMDNTVIRPFQTLLIDAFDMILAYNNISLKLYFKTLQPLEFTDLENVEDEETREEETGVKLSKETIRKKLNEIGQDESELLAEYDLVHEAEVDYDLEDELDEIVAELNKPKDDTLLSKILKFAKVGKATPYRESEQDGTSKKESQKGVEFLVRYMYTEAPGKLKTDKTREFCDEMMAANKVYRKEDIIAFDSQELNPGFQKGGKNNPDGKYSIWFYKGGPRCNHRWTRKLYAKKGGRSLGEAITTTQAIKRGFRPEANDRKVSIAPKNMDYAGYTKEYWDKMGFEN